MIIVSAGVVMNVILAAVGFMIVFMIGYPVPGHRGQRGRQQPRRTRHDRRWNSVGLQPGDVLVSYDGKEMGGDFSRIPLNVALTHDGTRVARRSTRQRDTTDLYATPERSGSDGKGLLQLGVGQPFNWPAPSRQLPKMGTPRCSPRLICPISGCFNREIRSPGLPANP